MKRIFDHEKTSALKRKPNVLLAKLPNSDGVVTENSCPSARFKKPLGSCLVKASFPLFM